MTPSAESDGVDQTALWPRVGVVIATHNRPELMRRALASVVEQDYEGDIDVVVVYDRSEPDLRPDETPRRRIQVTTNHRTPGLAGARNTGITLLDTELVAFCDDDDVWEPGKLVAQVTALRDDPTAEFVTTAMAVDYSGERTVRQAGLDRVDFERLAASRMSMLHSSSFVFRRQAMVEGFGLVDEEIPNSMGEDWDLLLRAARRAPIRHLDEPLVTITWGATSYFNEAWRDKNAAHMYLLAHHPEMADDGRGAALMYAKLGFGYAALKERRESLRWIWKALRRRPTEPRIALSVLVWCGFPASRLQSILNRRGYGI